MQSEKIIVLRKVPYRETSLIIATLGEISGRLDFMIKGARTINKKKFPVVDLFREINVAYNDKGKGLINLHSAELAASYDEIARNTENFNDACRISNFILRNSHPGLPLPETFIALRNALKNLSECSSDNVFSWEALVKLVYLKENGFLPANPGEDESKNHEIIEQLISFAMDEITHGPVVPKSYIRDFNSWLNSFCLYHELKI